MIRHTTTPTALLLKVFANRSGATTIRRIKAAGNFSQSAITVTKNYALYKKLLYLFKKKEVKCRIFVCLIEKKLLYFVPKKRKEILAPFQKKIVVPKNNCMSF